MAVMQPHYRELFDALRAFVASHPHARVEPFKSALRDWGDTCIPVEAARLPAADLLEAALADCDAGARALLQASARHRHRLRWEQSYRKQDGLVPDAMLDGYGFAEITGLKGPFVSERIRSGIAVWGPGIDYPRHHHQAEEAYIVLAGSMQFQFEDGPPELYASGDVAFVESNRRHGLRTQADSLVVCYLWQAGDLRQTSRFD